MTLIKISQLLVATALIFQITAAVSAERSVFKSKKLSQHELTRWEKKKMDVEFKSIFSGENSAAFQKLNNNPWGAKRAQQPRRDAKKALVNWGGCRDYAYKQRGRCYAGGGDAYTCERYYDARVNRCNERF